MRLHYCGATTVEGEEKLCIEQNQDNVCGGFWSIVKDGAASRKLYVDSLRIPFQEEEGRYLHTSKLRGVKHFAIWPLSMLHRPVLEKTRGQAKFQFPKLGSNLTWKI
jgi:hypothetical protein